jgi:hypothetical protein
VQTFGVGVFLRSINCNFLARKGKSRRRVVAFERGAPGFARFVRVARTNDSKIRNCAQSGEMFDRLVRRTVFAETD